MFLACNPKKHQAVVQWSSSAFQWSVSSWAFSNPNDHVCVACSVPSVTTLALEERVNTCVLPMPLAWMCFEIHLKYNIFWRKASWGAVAFAYPVPLCSPSWKAAWPLAYTEDPRGAPLPIVLLPACFLVSHPRSFTACTDSILTRSAYMGLGALFPRM